MSETLSPAKPAQALTPQSTGRFLPALAILFIGSGCAALIYEIVWLQLLQLHIGASSVSLGVLLGTFMGGMCLGSILLPKLVSKSRHPLRVYAALEAGIGIIGLLELVLVPAISDMYVHFAATGMTSIILRAIFAGVCLLPPTMLMGATLPAIARYVQTTREGVSWLGFFYAGNILGAVFGCLLAGFYLLPHFDMATASFVAAGINASVAVLGVLLSLPAKYAPDAAAGPDLTLPPPRLDATVLVVIGLSGLTGLGAEVVWTRMLSLLLGGSVYTFSNILAVFLGGLGIGSAIGAMMARSSPSPRVPLAVCQFLLALSIGWAAYTMTYSMPFWPVNLAMASNAWVTFQMDLARTAWVVLPGAVLWGASFPLALAAVASRGRDAGKLVGRVYAANTVGAIIGALVFSTLVIPNVGTQGAQRMLIGLCTLSAVIALAPLLDIPNTARRVRLAGGMGAMVILALAAGVTVSPPNSMLVCYGRRCATWVYRMYPANDLTLNEIALLTQANRENLRVTLVDGEPTLPADAPNDAQDWVVQHHDELASALRKGARMRLPGDEASSGGYGDRADMRLPPDRYCAYVGEGINFSVAVDVDSAGYVYYHGAGKVQASTLPEDMRLQRTLGHIAALVHAKPEKVLVVACGAGVTAGSFVPYDSVKRIVICDIEHMVPDNVADRYFKKENYGVVHDPRTQVIIDDGRHFIKTTDEKFDVITSDPVDPWVKGCAALSTIEYYQMCNAHLKPGGVVALWIPLYEMNEDTAKSLIATFFKVFPKSGIIWGNDQNGAGYDVVLFGRANDEPSRINLDQVQAFIDANPRVQASLQDVGYGKTAGEAVEICSTFAADHHLAAHWLQDTDRLINTDANLRLQYVAGLSFNEDHAELIFSNILKDYKFPAATFAGSSEGKIADLKKLLADTGRVEK